MVLFMPASSQLLKETELLMQHGKRSNDLDSDSFDSDNEGECKC